MITGRVGLIGNGKTMLAVRDAIATADRRGAVLASNIWIEGSAPWGGELLIGDSAPRVQLSVGEDGFDMAELRAVVAAAKAQARGVVLLVDEIGILMPARFWQSFPIDLMYQFSQSRKDRLDVYWTSQDIEDVDAYLRRKTQWVYQVRAFPTPTVERQERGQRPLFFLETKWRPATVGKKDKRLGRSFIRYRRAWETVYDTDELVIPPARLSRRQGRRTAASEAAQPA